MDDFLAVSPGWSPSTHGGLQVSQSSPDSVWHGSAAIEPLLCKVMFGYNVGAGDQVAGPVKGLFIRYDSNGTWHSGLDR